MLFFKSSSTLALAGLVAFHCCLRPAWTCGDFSRRDDTAGNSTYPWQEPGDEAPSQPATTGYFINHLCINVRNATESIAWYKQAFGLRLMFTLHVSEHFSISYMGHSHGGRNGTGYQTSDEMNRDKNNIEGLIEILSLDYPGWDLPAGTRVPNTFSHIGLVVPNITDTQLRLEAMGANIIKGAGDTFKLDGPFAVSSGFTQPGVDDVIGQDETDALTATLVQINSPLMYVADPDGTIIEIQSQ